MNIKILPVARQDIRDNIKWYNKQKKGLGKLFYVSVKSRLAYIKENPLHYQIKYRHIRQAKVNKYPYLINYVINEKENQVVILSVMYAGQDPEKWKKRS